MKDTNLDTPPHLELNEEKIDTLIEQIAHLNSYKEHFSKYIEAIENELKNGNSSYRINRARYYGKYIEDLMLELEADKSFTECNKEKSEFVNIMATLADGLGENENVELNLNYTKARLKALGMERKGDEVQESANILEKNLIKKQVFLQTSNHIENKLIPWAESNNLQEEALNLKVQNEILFSNSKEESGKSKEYGKKLWEKICNLLWRPKKITHNKQESINRCKKRLLQEKNSIIKQAFNEIKSLIAGKKTTLNQQVEENISKCNLKDHQKHHSKADIKEALVDKQNIVQKYDNVTSIAPKRPLQIYRT